MKEQLGIEVRMGKTRYIGNLILALALVAGPVQSYATDEALAKLSFSKKLQLAKAGDPDAKMALAEAYEQGQNTRADPVKAAKWYREAALTGNIDAQFRLAKLMSRGAPGLTADKATALKLLQEGAKRGHALSQNLLGLMLQNGDGTAKDEKAAVGWYRKASDQKLAEAETNLGVMYLKGFGVERNLDEAFKLFDRAATDGDGWAMNNLGGMFEMGWGTPKNLDKAREYYGKAAEKGIAMGTQNLARLKPVAGLTKP